MPSYQIHVFYSSTDGKIWHIIRSFNLETNGSADQVGFLAQSPEGMGALVVFSEIDYKPTKIPNIYNWKNPPAPKQQPGK
jgi:regulation of enolase protein 1 (concanavalin A-like superfamily)